MNAVSVFLLILKTAGIVLLCILTFALLCLLAVLFVPIRYRVDASYRDAPRGRLRVTWLLRLFSAKLDYKTQEENKNALSIRVAICGIPVFRRQMPLGGANETTEGQRQPAKEAGEQKRPAQEERNKADGNGEESRKEERKGNRKESGRKTALSLQTKTHGLVEFLRDESTRSAIILCAKQAGGLIRSILPRKTKADILFGTGDAESTGRIYGYCWQIIPYLSKCEISLDADLERKIFRAEGGLAGRIRLARLVYAVCALYMNRDVRRTLDHIRRARAAQNS